MTALCWLPGSRLVAGTASGRVAVYMVAAEEASPAASPRPQATADARAAAQQHAVPSVASSRTRQQGSPREAAAEASHEEAAGSFAQMSLEGRQPRAVRTSAPRPAQAPQQQPPGGQPAYPPVAFAAGMGPAAVGLPMGMPPQFAPPQGYYGPGGRAAGPGGNGNGNGGQRRRQQGQGQGPPQPQGPLPAPGYPRGYELGPYPRTPPSSRGDYGGPPPWQQQPGGMGGRSGQGPGGRAGNGGPMSPDQYQGRSPFAPLVSAGSGPLRSPAGGNGDRNGGRRGGQGWGSGGGGAGGGGGGQAQYGMSSSLMQVGLLQAGGCCRTGHLQRRGDLSLGGQ